MSDTFDQEGGAWADFEARGFEDEGTYYGGQTRGPSRQQITKDYLYYHVKVKVFKFGEETQKSITLHLTKDDIIGVRVPLSVCRKRREDSVYIWRDLMDKIHIHRNLLFRQEQNRKDVLKNLGIV